MYKLFSRIQNIQYKLLSWFVFKLFSIQGLWRMFDWISIYQQSMPMFTRILQEGRIVCISLCSAVTWASRLFFSRLICSTSCSSHALTTFFEACWQESSNSVYGCYWGTCWQESLLHWGLLGYLDSAPEFWLRENLGKLNFLWIPLLKSHFYLERLHLDISEYLAIFKPIKC